MSTPNDPHEVIESLVAVISLFNRLTRMRLRQEIEDETTLSQIRVIGTLKDKPITLSELAVQRAVTRQAASLQVQGMVEKGWVRRVPDPNDRRCALLEVTEEGLAHWREARRSLNDYLATLFKDLTPDEIAAFQAILPTIQRVLSQAQAEVKV